MAAEAAFPVCGGNGMGFFNFDARTFVSFQEPSFTAPGHIAAICHSGSVFAMLADSAGRYGFNLLTAQGQEISGTAADYMDFALELPTTRVIALFLESVRDPARFVAALEKAAACGIPVVVTKVGRTEASARLAVTHSGALAGNDTAFEALCDRYGVLRTDDLDSLMAACQILSLDRKIGTGKLAALLDSGGLRELMIDLAEEKGVEFAELTPSSVDSLSSILDSRPSILSMRRAFITRILARLSEAVWTFWPEIPTLRSSPTNISRQTRPRGLPVSPRRPGGQVPDPGSHMF